LNALYQNLLNQNIYNVQIIAIGKEQYSADNPDWTSDNSIPVLNDPLPNNTWENWGANQWDLFFLDQNGNYVEDFNINTWDYDKIYNTIMDIISGCTNSGAENFNPNATIDDGSCTSTLENIKILNQFNIMAIYPNPFNPTTSVSFSIPEYGYTSVTINDLFGRHVETLANMNLNPGIYKIEWNASSFPSGVYLINMESRNFQQIRKVVLLK